MAQHAAQKAQIAGQEIAGVFRLVGQGLDCGDQPIVHPFVGIQVQLPRLRHRKIVDCPIALSAVVFKWVLHDGGAERAGKLNCTVAAERVDDEDFVGDPTGALKSSGERSFRVKG